MYWFDEAGGEGEGPSVVLVTPTVEHAAASSGVPTAKPDAMMVPQLSRGISASIPVVSKHLTVLSAVGPEQSNTSNASEQWCNHVVGATTTTTTTVRSTATLSGQMGDGDLLMFGGLITDEPSAPSPIGAQESASGCKGGGAHVYRELQLSRPLECCICDRLLKVDDTYFSCKNCTQDLCASCHAGDDEAPPQRQAARAVSAELVQCTQCRQPFKGFGQVCKDCRRSGPLGNIQACLECGHFFQGFAQTCPDCSSGMLPEPSL